MKRGLMPLAATFALASWAAADDGQIVKDRQGFCQISVPSDWTPGKTIHSMAASPDKKSSSIISAQRAGADYHLTVETAKSTYSVTKTVEASNSRTVLVYANTNGKPGGGVYVATGGPQICVASIDFAGPAFEAQAIKIASTVKPAK